MKKFFTVFILCMGLFSTLAFADTNSNTLIYKTNGGKYRVEYDSYSLRDYKGRSQVGFTNVKFREFKNGQWVEIEGYDDGISIYVFVDAITGIYECTDEHLSNYLIGEGCVMVPPGVTPTLETEMPIFLRDFGSQSVTVLKVGLTVLALLLGISLVPRVIYSFL